MTMQKMLGLVAAAVLTTVATAAGMPPKPSPALASRIAAGDCEIYGIV